MRKECLFSVKNGVRKDKQGIMDVVKKGHFGTKHFPCMTRGESGGKPCNLQERLMSRLDKMLTEAFYFRTLYKEEITRKKTYAI